MKRLWLFRLGFSILAGLFLVGFQVTKPSALIVAAIVGLILFGLLTLSDVGMAKFMSRKKRR